MLELGIIALLLNKIIKINTINNRITIQILLCKINEILILNKEYTTFDLNFKNGGNNGEIQNQIIQILLIGIIIKQILINDKLDNENSIYQMSQLQGGIYLITSNDMLTTLVAWELMNISIYLYMIDEKSEKTLSGILKYIILSGYMFTFLLLMIGLIYYENGSINYENIQWNDQKKYSLIFIPILFKLNIIPFHNWAPDLYNSLSYTKNIWLLIVPKFIFVLFLINLQNIISMDILHIFIIISIIIGSISLYNQILIKRFFIYSSITQYGYLLLLISLSEIELSLIYLLIYSINFLSILSYFILRPINQIGELKGISYTHYILTSLLFINIFSLAGLPPFNGFFIKLNLLETLFIYQNYFYIGLIIIFSLLNTINYLKLIEISSLPNNRSAIYSTLISNNSFIIYFFVYSSLFNLFYFFNYELFYLFL